MGWLVVGVAPASVRPLTAAAAVGTPVIALVMVVDVAPTVATKAKNFETSIWAALATKMTSWLRICSRVARK